VKTIEEILDDYVDYYRETMPEIPKDLPLNKDKQFTFRMGWELYNEIKEISRKQEKHMTDIVKDIMFAWLKEHKKK
jgi:hypothetical protein